MANQQEDPRNIVVMANETPYPRLRAHLREVGLFIPPALARVNTGPPSVQRQQRSAPELPSAQPQRERAAPAPDPRPMHQIDAVTSDQRPAGYPGEPIRHPGQPLLIPAR